MLRQALALHEGWGSVALCVSEMRGMLVRAAWRKTHHAPRHPSNPSLHPPRNAPRAPRLHPAPRAHEACTANRPAPRTPPPPRTPHAPARPPAAPQACAAARRRSRSACPSAGPLTRACRAALPRLARLGRACARRAQARARQARVNPRKPSPWAQGGLPGRRRSQALVRAVRQARRACRVRRVPRGGGGPRRERRSARGGLACAQENALQQRRCLARANAPPARKMEGG